MLKVALVYVLAALAEIGGCFSFWLWPRSVGFGLLKA